MRWFFVLLLLANGFYALWQFQNQPPERVVAGMANSAQVPTLMLVSEADPQLLVRNRPLEREDVAPAPEIITSECWFISVFDNKKAADRAVAAVQSAQLEARLDVVDVEDRSDYWVHIGPFARRDRALGALQQLREKNIDSFLIGDGELKNGISLGFFSQKTSAERLARRHQGIGYPVKILEVKRFRPSYHLYAFGRVEKEDLIALMKAQGQLVDPAKKSKKSCI